MRFNTDTALKLVREGRWQTPTGIKESYDFEGKDEKKRKLFRQASPQGLNDILTAMIPVGLQ